MQRLSTVPTEDKYDYPQTRSGRKKRKFRPEWALKYDGLAYSKTEDAAFCKYCVFFSASVKRGALVDTGFRNWKKATEVFDAHFYGAKKMILNILLVSISIGHAKSNG